VTAVFVPDKPSRVVRAEASEAASVRQARRAAPEPPAAAEAPAPTTVEGYVLFAVGATTFAVAVGEVREIVRAARLELLPQSHVAYGYGVALVDVRGRAIPVVDLRSERASRGDVLLPMWRHQVGLVVDHVVAVHSPHELVREHDDVPAALPSYARGILRPVEGGAPVLLIAMPDAAELEADGGRTEGPRLGDDVLADLGLDDVQVVPESG
jgi:chemotaxis signal transduction protein